MSDPKPAFSRLRLSLPVLLLALSSSQSLAIESSPVIEEMGAASEEVAAFQNLLFVDPRGTQAQRTEFIRTLSQVGKNNRQLIEAKVGSVQRCIDSDSSAPRRLPG